MPPTPNNADEDLDLPAPLRAGLERGARPGFGVERRVDDAVLAAARAQLGAAARRRGNRVLPWAVAAAVTLLLVSVSPWWAPRPGGPGGPGTTGVPGATILPAFALARQMEAGQTPRDPAAVERLALAAVALAPPEGAPRDVAPAPGGPVRFVPVAVYVDPKGQALAAYQVRFTTVRGAVRVVGVEAGEAPAFRDTPPYYDRQAVAAGASDRVIVAMFSTEAAGGLPTGRTRVTTLHLEVRGAAPPVFEARLDVAADAAGHAIPAEVSFVEGVAP